MGAGGGLRTHLMTTMQLPRIRSHFRSFASAGNPGSGGKSVGFLVSCATSEWVAPETVEAPRSDRDAVASESPSKSPSVSSKRTEPSSKEFRAGGVKGAASNSSRSSTFFSSSRRLKMCGSPSVSDIPFPFLLLAFVCCVIGRRWSRSDICFPSVLLGTPPPPTGLKPVVRTGSSFFRH